MQFAIKTSPQHTSWVDMLTVWQAADEMDVFHSAWNFDHFYPINVADTHGPCMEAWTTLSALAQATRRIRIGCMVTGVVYRHPALLANMIASLDIISNGRLEVGLGAGWSQEECDAYGFPLGSLTERFDRFDEACAVIHSLLTSEVTNHSGRYFTLTDARCNPKPVQQPHPPICIGGNGEKRTFPNVARYAQHWNYAGFDVEGFIAKRRVLDAQLATAGRKPDAVISSAHLPLPEGDYSKALDTAAAFRDAGLDLIIFYLPPPHRTTQLEAAARIAEALPPG